MNGNKLRVTVALGLSLLLCGCSWCAPWDRPYVLRHWEDFQQDCMEALREADYRKAERAGKQACAYAKQLGTGDRRYAISCTDLALVYQYQKEPNLARPLFRSAVDTISRILQFEKDRAMRKLLLETRARAYQGLGTIEISKGEDVAAVGNCRKAVADRKEAMSIRTSHVPDRLAMQVIAGQMADLAYALDQAGMIAEAETAYAQAIRTAEIGLSLDGQLVPMKQRYRNFLEKTGKSTEVDELKDQPPWIRDVVAGRGEFKNKNFLEAIRFYKQALQAARKNNLDPMFFAMVYDYLGRCQSIVGRRKESIASYRNALANRVKLFGEDEPSIDSTLGKIADISFGAGLYREAADAYKRRAELRGRIYGKMSESRTEPLVKLAYSYLLDNRPDEALRAAEAVFPIVIAHPSPAHDYETTSHLAELLFKLCKLNKSEQLYQFFVGQYPEGSDIEWSRQVLPFFEYAELLDETGRKDKARQYYERGNRMLSALGARQRYILARVMVDNAEWYESAGQKHRAEKNYRKASEILESIKLPAVSRADVKSGIISLSEALKPKLGKGNSKDRNHNN